MISAGYPLARLHPAAQRDQWRWRRLFTDALQNPAIAAELHATATTLDASNYRTANQRVRELAGMLRAANIHRAFDEQKIRDFAENRAQLCSRMSTLTARADFARFCGVEPPTEHPMRGSLTEWIDGALKRLADPLWWRRAVRKAWTRAAENGERELGMVRRGRAPYASDDAVRRRAAQKRRMREWLANHAVVNDDGEALALDLLAERSLANPALRRGEFMVRAKGFEEIATRLEHDALFFTLTTPSHFHAQLAEGGANPTFDRSTVRAGQAWLVKMWGRVRAKLHRRKVLVYGFRVAEPHHDGTVHWHALLFVRRHDAERVRALVSEIFLSEFGGDPGALAHRVKVETIDRSKGSATGYLAKYISKNLDGAGVIGNERSDEDTDRRVSGPGGTSERVDAWASTHGLRQFAQIGGPPISLYREARRLRDRVDDPDIEGARLLADRGRCGGFIEWIGGIACGRRTNLRLARAECGTRTRYGEARPSEIIGLRWASALVITRPCRWRIARKACSSTPLFSALGPVAITVRAGPGATEPRGWTNPHETSQAGPL